MFDKKAYMREYKRKNPVSKQALNEYQKQYRIKNHSHINELRRERHAEVKKLLFEKLGNACKRCGFSDTRALQIDHVHGGGKKDLVRGAHSTSRLMQLLNMENLHDYYQLLCANCNWIKSYENGERTKHLISVVSD